MNWTLFGVATAAWIFWGAHFVARKAVAQMSIAGIGSANNPLLSLSNALTGFALLNFVVFFIVYGIKSSWLGALFIVFGGYVASLIYMAVTRPVYNSFLIPTMTLGWLGLPALSGLMWYLAL